MTRSKLPQSLDNLSVVKLEFQGKWLRYRRVGAGPPILWIHAFPFSRAMWEPQLEAVAARWNAVAIDLPGFGGSDSFPEEETSIELYASACEAVVEHVAAKDPWVVAGCSLGGYVAFEIVRRRQVPLHALVLADTRAPADSDEQRAARRALADRVRREGTGAVAEVQLPRMVTPLCEPKVRSQVDRWMRGAAEAGVLGALRALGERADSRATLAAIDVPALVVCGSEDPISTPAEMEAMARELRRATFVKIENAAHLANVERPEEFNDALAAWLGSL